MGADAEERLSHDDERRDVEDEVRGQIVEIQAVVEHEPPDKWLKREAQSAEEMGEEHHPLMGTRGGDELPLFGKPVRNVASQRRPSTCLPLRACLERVEEKDADLGAGARVRENG